MLQGVQAFQIGDIAEALATYRLLASGIPVHKSRGRRTHDLIIEYEGKLLSVQVKGTSKTEVTKSGLEKFSFLLGRGCQAKYLYEDNDYDILACVALPTERILYYPKLNKLRHRVRSEHMTEQAEIMSLAETLEKVRWT